MNQVKKLMIYMNSGIEVKMEVGIWGFKQADLNYAFESLEKGLPMFVIDTEFEGNRSRQRFTTSHIAFYRAEFSEPLLGYNEFTDKVAKRLHEIEYNHNVVGISISKDDFERLFSEHPFDAKKKGSKSRYLGRELVFDNKLKTGEFEFLTDKGEEIK